MIHPPTPLPPLDREVLRSTTRPEADGTRVVEEEWRADAGWTPLPLHRHTDCDERYEILDGLVRVRVGGAARTYRAGESVIVGRGEVHTLEPVDGHGAHVRVQRSQLHPDHPIPPAGA